MMMKRKRKKTKQKKKKKKEKEQNRGQTVGVIHDCQDRRYHIAALS